MQVRDAGGFGLGCDGIALNMKGKKSNLVSRVCTCNDATQVICPFTANAHLFKKRVFVCLFRSVCARAEDANPICRVESLGRGEDACVCDVQGWIGT